MIKSKRSLEGYLQVDHSCGPGISQDTIFNSGLKMPLEIAKFRNYESATNTCSHCCAVVILNPARDRPRGYCPKCDAYVCDNPICNKECSPYIARMEADINKIIHKGVF
jgi:hypothetical protein